MWWDIFAETPLHCFTGTCDLVAPTCWFNLSPVGQLKAWSGLKFKLSKEAEALCVAATECTVGNGELTLVWRDRWLDGQSAKEIAPDLLAFAKPQNDLQMTVREALTNNNWIIAIQGSLSVPAIVQFMHLWQQVQLAPELTTEPDKCK